MILIVAVLAFGVSCAWADLDYKRVHVMDKIGTSWLFRGNFPQITEANGTTRFADPEIFEYMQERARQEANASLPAHYNFTIVSFDNIFELNIWEEIAWAEKHNVTLSYWTLLGELIPPKDWPADVREWARKNPGQFWETDRLPSRVNALHEQMKAANKAGEPLVIYSHCEAGCDRTGEWAAAWYMTFKDMNVTGAYALDTAQCGRAPNDFSTGAISWYCWTQEPEIGRDLGDCLYFMGNSTTTKK